MSALPAQRQRELANSIDALDDAIRDLNGQKRDLWEDARGELKGLGLDAASLRLDLAGLKGAIARRRALRDEPGKLFDREAAIEDVLTVIMPRTCTDPRVREDGETRQSGGSHPEPAASGNASGSGEGADVTGAQGYSADPEAPKDSVSRTGRRNAAACRDEGEASPEHGRNRGHEVSREGASEPSPGPTAVGQMDAEVITQATDPAHGSATPAVERVGEAVRGGAPEARAVGQSGVTGARGLHHIPRDSASDLDRASGDDRSPAMPGSSPQPGAGRERSGASSPERDAAIAAIRARQTSAPLDPASPLFPILFRARYGRDPAGDECVIGAPAAATEAA